MKARIRLIVLRAAIRRATAKDNPTGIDNYLAKKALSNAGLLAGLRSRRPRTHAFGASSLPNRRHATAAHHPKETSDLIAVIALGRSHSRTQQTAMRLPAGAVTAFGVAPPRPLAPNRPLPPGTRLRSSRLWTPHTTGRRRRWRVWHQ